MIERLQEAAERAADRSGNGIVLRVMLHPAAFAVEGQKDAHRCTLMVSYEVVSTASGVNPLVLGLDEVKRRLEQLL